MSDSDHENTRVASGCMQMALGDLGAALKSEIQRLAGGHPAHRQFARKHELACLRMASDCMQLVGEIQDIELQQRFLELARQLAEAAEPTQTSGPTMSV